MSDERKSAREMIAAGDSPYDDKGRHAGSQGSYHDQVLRATYGDNDDVHLLEYLGEGANRAHILQFDPHKDVTEQAFQLLRRQPIARLPRKGADEGKRKNLFITEAQFRSAYTATYMSSSSLRVLNVFVTFALDDEADEILFNGHFDAWLASLADWFRRKGELLRYVYVLEHPPQKHRHAHVLINVPDGLLDEYCVWCRKSLRRIAPRYYAKNSRAIQRSKDGRRGDQWNWFQYMMKGIDPYAGWRRGKVRPRPYEFARKLEIRRSWLKPQGTIMSKRVGYSQALSFRKHGIDDLLDDVSQKTPAEIWQKDDW